jgi:hypothetical protein
MVVFASCQLNEPITLDLNQAPPKVVIEAQVTDRVGYQYVKLSRSGNFYDAARTPRIKDALVTVTDDSGEVVNFTHNPNNHPDSSGIYIPPHSFVGKIGRTYSLKVEIDGETFTGTDKLADVIPVDSLTYRVHEDEVEDPEIEGKFYELLLFAREPQNEKNFYLFKFYRNDSLVYDLETDIYYTNDDFLAEKIDGVSAPAFYGLKDKAFVEVFSLSRQGYVYYNDLWTLLNGDSGGMFSPIPSSPRTNLTNGALGFFQVSALSTAEIVLE